MKKKNVTLVRINPVTGKKIVRYLRCEEEFAWLNPACQRYAHHAGCLSFSGADGNTS